MRKYIKLSLVFFLLVGFMACKKSQVENRKNQQKVHCGKVYKTCDSLEEVAKQDTGAIHNSEYGSKMEHAMCEKAKLMRGLSNEDRLLLEYGEAKELLVNISNEGKKHPELYKDKKFVLKANDRMEKVRSYYSQLKNVNLNSDQMKRFCEITKQKI
ncbi:hypothetical protein [uncultured Bacteroides sp.]|uniref:hypothetical protein n=1 Tax=uncultured Bacteroides sp. TaxID=162156 RepID=UPI002AABD673|nr:hypothetical protein [uncultured Bacteroides sp.]